MARTPTARRPAKVRSRRTARGTPPASSAPWSVWPQPGRRPGSRSAGSPRAGCRPPAREGRRAGRRARRRPPAARTTRWGRRRGRPTAARSCRPTTASCCAVEEIGPPDAPLTVVFVHGYTLSMASWTFQRRTLAAELATANGHRPDARLVFYDQRGHGASGRGDADHSTIEQLARDLEAVLESRVPRGPVVLVGHSMGGMTIMGLAALRPGPVRLEGGRRGADLDVERQPRRPQLRHARAADPRPDGVLPGRRVDDAPPTGPRRTHPADGRGARLDDHPVAVVRVRPTSTRRSATTSTP